MSLKEFINYLKREKRKSMKKVFSSNEQLSHVWGRQSQVEGSAGSVHFYNGVLFSYGTAIAELFNTDSGLKIALVDSYIYSSSTCKHQSLARNAVSSDYIVIDKLELNLNRRDSRLLKPESQVYFDNIALDNETRAAYLFLKAKRASKHRDRYTSEANGILIDIKNLADYCGFTYLEKINIDELLASREAFKLAEIENEKKERAKRAEKQTEQLQAWRAGGSYTGYFEMTALRINKEAQLIETSKRASIPLDRAADIWRAVVIIHNRGSAQTNLNVKIDSHYTLSSYKKGVFNIGCHNIDFSEFEHLAIQLGFISGSIDQKKAA